VSRIVSGIALGGGSEDGAGKAARLPLGRRLLRHADFERVYKHGKRHFAACMTVFYLARDQGLTGRIGFTVGRALGGAVDRNRMKRRLREAVRSQGTIGVPVDVVINPKRSLLTADFRELQREIAEVFQLIERKFNINQKDRATQKGKPS
jgi:ribonuclease P protein component